MYSEASTRLATSNQNLKDSKLRGRRLHSPSLHLASALSRPRTKLPAYWGSNSNPIQPTCVCLVF